MRLVRYNRRLFLQKSGWLPAANGLCSICSIAGADVAARYATLPDDGGSSRAQRAYCRAHALSYLDKVAGQVNMSGLPTDLLPFVLALRMIHSQIPKNLLKLA